MRKQGNFQQSAVRPHSAILKRNYQNIQLHSCLDQAKEYTDRVKQHLQKTQYQNHALTSAERGYKQKTILLRTKSSQGFRRSLSSRKVVGQPAILTQSHFQNKQSNPQNLRILSQFEVRTLKMSEIKDEFDDGIQQKYYLKKRIEQLKKLMVVQKNRKAKVSLMNSKLMNFSQISNYEIQKLNQKSRRNGIQINELYKDIEILYAQTANLQIQNQNLSAQIRATQSNINNLEYFVKSTKSNLSKERSNLQDLKQIQAISCKQMTNLYMILNLRKQQKAMLLNRIDDDVLKNI